MNYWIKYIFTFLIIKKKQFDKLFFSLKKNEYTKFVILCAPRSGSNWLHTLLNSHAQIFSYGEILRRRFEKAPTQVILPLDQLVFSPHQKQVKAVGLKLFYHYLNENNYRQSFQEIVNDTSIKIIHLTRKKTLEQYLSLIKAQESKKWSQSQSSTKFASIHINPNEFYEYKHNQSINEQAVLKVFEKHKIFTLTYEDLYSKPEGLLEELQLFLKVKPTKLFSLLTKQATGNFKDSILNWKDFEKRN
ncbi:MAG: sulfotransferase [Cyclobacteriaceae bacterium]|nr:sulfotransferase [Cyclobacteriaceae bacterium]